MTASISWELDREHEEFKAGVQAFMDRRDLAGLRAAQPAVAAEAVPAA
jgi:hypothetical protein